MLILLSPAKTLDYDTPPRTKQVSTPQFLDESEKLVSTLRAYKPKRLGKLMNISDALAELNVERFDAWQVPFPNDQARPSIQAFRGDVYLGLDADTMSMASIKRAQKHIRILSGLYGVLKPLDNMLPYRLEMGTALKTKRGKNLYEFWGSRITESLNEELESFKSPMVINLASNEYFKVVKPKELQAPLISPVFKDQKNGEYKVISFFAKKARGAMARYLVESKCSSQDDLKQFDALGYKYNTKASTEQSPVFMRTEKAANSQL
jgi:cytoplasmic iron level regulating protein YaaA (DUF328/UPF0246 family)